MTLQKKDFIEIEFTAKVRDGEVFDSNVKEELEKLHVGHNHPVESKPFVFSLGEGMFLNGVEDFLIGKPSEKFPVEYKIELSPEKAFGKRNQKLIQMMPMKVFIQQKINPVPGFMFNFDGRVGKVLSSSGGRVMVDFNNPLSGKEIIYDIKILRKVEDINDKANAFIEFLFRRQIPFTIKDKKLILEVEKQMKNFAEMFKEKFKEILDLDLEIKDSEEEIKEKIEKPEEKK